MSPLGNSLYYFCDSSVSLKLFQNRKLKLKLTRGRGMERWKETSPGSHLSTARGCWRPPNPPWTTHCLEPINSLLIHRREIYGPTRTSRRVNYRQAAWTEIWKKKWGRRSQQSRIPTESRERCQFMPRTLESRLQKVGAECRIEKEAWL